jgi:arylsulfatase A-like enzyme
VDFRAGDDGVEVQDLRLDRETVVVLVSDHGFYLGEHGLTGKLHTVLHPELTHVPLILVDPQRRLEGQRSDYRASTHDIGPTLLSMVGIDAPDWMTGTDLSVTLDGKEPAEKRDFHYGGMYNRFYIRTDDWVLIGDNRGQGVLSGIADGTRYR